MILSEQIRRGRKQLGMSQADLADAIWVSRNTISNWESGATTPDIQSLVLMSALFGVTLDQMVKDDDQVMAQAFARDKNHILLASSVIDASGTNESETDGSNEEDLSLFGLRHWETRCMASLKTPRSPTRAGLHTAWCARHRSLAERSISS